MLFYAPIRGMREVRDRGALAPAALIALVTQFFYSLATQWLAGGGNALLGAPASGVRLVIQSATFLLLIAGVLVPIIAFVSNIS